MKRENNKIGQGIFETVAAARPARPAPARPSVQKKKKKKKKKIQIVTQMLKLILKTGWLMILSPNNSPLFMFSIRYHSRTATVELWNTFILPHVLRVT